MAKRKVSKTRKSKTIKTPKKLSLKAVSANRTEGIRLFKLAGRPTKEQFVLVYGERGPKMTWDQRAAAGVPAKKFQGALATKSRGNLALETASPAAAAESGGIVWF